MNGVPLIVIIGGAAVVALLVLAIVLVVRGRKPREDDAPAGSFLGARPQDTFAGLGEPEAPTELADDEFRLDWGHGDEDIAPRAKPAREAPAPAGTAHDVQALHPAATGREPDPRVALEAAPGAAEVTGAEAVPAAEPETDTALAAEDEARAESQAAGEEKSGAPTDAAEEKPARGEPDADATAPVPGGERPGGDEGTTLHDEAGETSTEPRLAAAPAPPPRVPRMVPLSEIIVTTSRKKVDLDDPEVRRMLTELVRYEIDQAAEFSTAGQSVDAVLQLTEAEKVSRALGMDETAERIKTLMRDLRD